LLKTKHTLNVSTIVEKDVKIEVDIKTERYHYVNFDEKLVRPTNMFVITLSHNDDNYYVYETLKSNLFIASNFSNNNILYRSSLYNKNKKNIMRFNAINIDYIKLNDKYVVFNTFNTLNKGEIYTKHDNKHNDEELYIKYLIGRKLNISESKQVLKYIFNNNVRTSDVDNLLKLFASYVYYNDETSGKKLYSTENNFVNNVLDIGINKIDEYNQFVRTINSKILFRLFGIDIEITEHVTNTLIKLLSI
jgi:hypothetical protein